MVAMLKPLTLVTLLALAGAASAQEATESTGEEATPPGGDLSLGEEVNPVGAPYILNQSGDWAVRCVRAPEGQEDPCQLYQLLIDEEGNRVAEFSIFPLPGNGQAVAGAAIVAPLETLLTEQLTLTVDGGAARRYPFTFCNAAGCVSRIGFTAENVAQFKRGAQAVVRLVPAGAPDQEVRLTVSLSGFTAGFDSLTPAAE